MSAMRTICPRASSPSGSGCREMMCPLPFECLRMPSRTSALRFSPCPSRSSCSTTRSDCLTWWKPSGMSFASTFSPAWPNGVWPRSWPITIASVSDLVQAERPRHRARDLRHLQRVRDARAVVIALGREEHLGLARQPPERLRMDDPIAIVLEDRAQRIGRLGPRAPLAVAAALRERRQHALLVVFQLLADGRHRRFFGLPAPAVASRGGRCRRSLRQGCSRAACCRPGPCARSCRARSVSRRGGRAFRGGPPFRSAPLAAEAVAAVLVVAWRGAQPARSRPCGGPR